MLTAPSQSVSYLMGGLMTRVLCVLPEAPPSAASSPFLPCQLCSERPWLILTQLHVLLEGRRLRKSSPSVRQGFTFKQTKCVYCCKHRGKERLSQKINFSCRCQAKSHPGYKKLGLAFVSEPWSGTALGRPVFRIRSRGCRLMDPVGEGPEMIYFSLL